MFLTFAESIRPRRLSRSARHRHDSGAGGLVRDYLEGFGKRHAESSLGQLRALVLEGEELPAVEERLEEWSARRPEKIITNETVRGSNAVARLVFLLAGVRTLRWVAQGGRSCPYCRRLDGQVVGLEEHFDADGELEGERPMGMKVNGSKAHPPLHQGCVCAVVAG